jgi:acyl-CoA synthetase (NDP forming)
MSAQRRQEANFAGPQALEELLLHVSAMVEEVPEIAEMDFNPIKVMSPGRGCVVVDSRVLLRRI